MTDPMEDYRRAVNTLNNAAHDAIRACKDTTMLPNIDRQSLRSIACETDRLVDHMFNSADGLSRIKASGN